MRCVLAARSALSVAVVTAAAGCNLVAGLGDFVPADTTSATSGASSGNAGGSGGSFGTSTSTSGSTHTSSPASSTAGAGGSSGCSDHLLVNELRVEGGDYVEIYNPTAQPMSVGGLEIKARTMGGGVQAKWTGPAVMIAPHAYYVVASSSATVDHDSVLDVGIDADSDPTVVALVDGLDVVDSICICSSASTCTFDLGGELCDGRALVSDDFHVTGNLLTAGRVSCNDTDHDDTDFMLGCETARAENFVCQ